MRICCRSSTESQSFEVYAITFSYCMNRNRLCSLWIPSLWRHALGDGRNLTNTCLHRSINRQPALVSRAKDSALTVWRHGAAMMNPVLPHPTSWRHVPDHVVITWPLPSSCSRKLEWRYGSMVAYPLTDRALGTGGSHFLSRECPLATVALRWCCPPIALSCTPLVPYTVCRPTYERGDVYTS
jgi:hypothetical protein